MKRQSLQPAASTLLLAGADGCLLWFARPDPARLAFVVSHGSTALARFGTDTVLATFARAGLWIAAVWVAIGLLTVLGGALPGAAGRFCCRSGALIVPAAMRRVVIGAVGLGLLAGPTTSAFAAPPTLVAQPGCARPTGAVAVLRGPAEPRLLGSARAPSDAAPTPPPWPGTPPPTTPPRTPPPDRATHAAGSDDADSVRVRAGDSLWLIASRRLDPHDDASDVAAYWPRVYAANRAVVGPDPALVHPGQVLHLPAPERSR